jgi:hypothetical protein
MDGFDQFATGFLKLRKIYDGCREAAGTPAKAHATHLQPFPFTHFGFRSKQASILRQWWQG